MIELIKSCYVRSICCVSTFRFPPRRMKSTYPGLLPLNAPTASCARPNTKPIAMPDLAVLAAVMRGKRSCNQSAMRILT